ncbi:hypothetical protein ANANG_G00301240 [Anguilla anguilla]|uniref:Uncharacterized protein n=1 Tax=Anguilla anguilla TaxID=7936 RepID=A0A9D3RIC1_ANGAN|nr:hypothetical protein ANANG_G00301240 [Anguilla anguilla]
MSLRANLQQFSAIHSARTRPSVTLALTSSLCVNRLKAAQGPVLSLMSRGPEPRRFSSWGPCFRP